jgi:glycosyltransferase involved in cell wall biosynthesis
MRYSRILQSLGYRTRVVSSSEVVPAADLLLALHARKSAALIAAFRKKFPARPIVVVLTGTDVYGALPRSRAALGALAAADAIVTLQPLAVRRIPRALRKKAVAVIQSARDLKLDHAPANCTCFCVIGNLRREKDPLRAAFALRYLKDPDVKVIQAGSILDPRYAAHVARIEAREPRYRYVGELSQLRALRLLATSDALVLSSRSEGGANVASEAIANRVPVLASRIDGNVGVFGSGYGGYYRVGSSKALAALMNRFVEDRSFALRLRRQIERLEPEVTFEHERRGLARAIAIARAQI